MEFDGWRGLPYPGYQHPFIYVHEKEDERLNNMINFMYDSQQAYFNKFGVLGPGAAAYVWNRWDNIKYGTPDTFTFYHWGMATRGQAISRVRLRPLLVLGMRWS